MFIGEVLVAKMPCLYPGDVRKYTAVNVPELKRCIRDCIVFPIKGPRPHPNEMSGSDLDGDKYWVGLRIKLFIRFRIIDQDLNYFWCNLLNRGICSHNILYVLRFRF